MDFEEKAMTVTVIVFFHAVITIENESVFTKENDKYQWFMLEQKSQCEIGVTQTDRHGTITASDNYE